MSTAALLLGTAAGSAVTQIKAGRQQQKAYFQQARLREQQAEQQRLQFKQQGIAALDNLLRTNATINARGAAGGIDPTSGSAVTLAQFNEASAANEAFMISQGSAMSQRIGELEAATMVTQGKAALEQSLASASSTLLSAAAASAGMGGKPGGKPGGTHPDGWGP